MKFYEEQEKLFEAIKENNVGEVKKLLEQNIEVNFYHLHINAKGENELLAPLHLAVEKNNEEIVKLLLSKGADPNFFDYPDQRSALHYAVLRDEQYDIAKLLCNIDGINLDSGTYIGLSPIFTASPKNKALLLERGAKSMLKHAIDYGSAVINNKMNLLQELKSTKKIPDQQEQVFLDMIVPLAPIMPLILETKVNGASRTKRRIEDGQDYQPFILRSEAEKASFRDHLKDMINRKEPFLFDFIYQSDEDVSRGHFDPVQVSFDGEKARIYTLNAGGDIKNEDEIRQLKFATNAKLKYFYSNRQADGYTCPIFSLQDLNALSNMTNNEKDRSLTGNYADLDPRFLRHTQFLKLFTDSYPNKEAVASKKGVSLNQYLSDVVHVEAKGEVKARNYNITDKVYKYVKAVKDQYLDKIKNQDPEIEAIIKNRTNFEGKNNFFKSALVVELLQKHAIDVVVGKPNALQGLLNTFPDEGSRVKAANFAIKKFIQLGNGRCIAEIIKAFPAEKRMEYFSDIVEEALIEFEANDKSEKSDAVLSAFESLAEKDSLMNQALLKPFAPIAKITLLGKKLNRYITGEYEAVKPISKKEKEIKSH